MDENKDYEVVDKRAATNEAVEPDPDPDPEKSTQKEAEEPVTEETEEQAEATESPDVYSMLGFFTSMLLDHAWVWMGLRVDPVSHAMKKDMAQARTAIDTLIFLAEKLAPRMEENEQRDLQNAISDLQLNFVQQSAKGE